MTKLEEIFQHKHHEIVEARHRVTVNDLEALLPTAPPVRGFRKALLDAADAISLIAEVKKASPSEGLIRPDFDPEQIAIAYRSAGAHCLSVLTDESYFQGSNRNLQIAREASGLPVLRKDFICDPYQVIEARVLGADAVLLIVAGLTPSLLSGLHALASDLGMDVLVEVHDEAETDRALELGANLIGVNNRNLHTFKTDLATSDTLIPRIAPHATAVAESAIKTFNDVQRMSQAGAKAVLVGTVFTRSPDIEPKVREVMGW